jgi:DNA repair protein RecO (recombination protein O)
MSSIKTDAVVLRAANYGECDRMLTLLSPTLGLVSVAAKGCRKATSRLLSATELFATGEYMLYEKAGRYTLTAFHPTAQFYPLRTDMDRLSHGVYWLNLCEAAAQPGEPSPRLFKMLLLSLAVLAFDALPLRALTGVFLMQFALLQGFAPRLDACARCGRAPVPPLRFDPEEGGVRCAACMGGGVPLDESTYAWLLEAQAKGAFVLAGRRALPPSDNGHASEIAFHLLRTHVEGRMEKPIPSGKNL